MKRLFTLFIAIALFASCSSTSNLSTASNLLNNKWVLSSLAGKTDLSSLFENKLPFLSFSNDGRITGNNGCNSLAGSFDVSTLSSGNIDLSNLISTQMACPNMTGSSQFNEMLQNVTSFKLKDQALNLLGSDGSTLASFIQGS